MGFLPTEISLAGALKASFSIIIMAMMTAGTKSTVRWANVSGVQSHDHLVKRQQGLSNLPGPNHGPTHTQEVGPVPHRHDRKRRQSRFHGEARRDLVPTLRLSCQRAGVRRNFCARAATGARLLGGSGTHPQRGDQPPRWWTWRLL